MKNKIYPQDKYVYLSAATSFLKAHGVDLNWHRGKEIITGSFPYIGHFLNKKWPLSEEYTLHFLYLQQVKGYFRAATCFNKSYLISWKMLIAESCYPEILLHIFPHQKLFIIIKIQSINFQAGLINLELGHREHKWEQELTVLKLQHLILPFMLLGVGICLAFVIFCLEKMEYCCYNKAKKL